MLGSKHLQNTRNDVSNQMEYDKFIECLDNIDAANFEELKKGFNSCDACLDFHIAVRELVGVIRFKVASNKKSRNEDKKVMHVFSENQTIIVAIAVKEGLCSHLKRVIDVPGLKKRDDYIIIQKMIDEDE